MSKTTFFLFFLQNVDFTHIAENTGSNAMPNISIKFDIWSIWMYTWSKNTYLLIDTTKRYRYKTFLKSINWNLSYNKVQAYEIRTYVVTVYVGYISQFVFMLALYSYERPLSFMQSLWRATNQFEQFDVQLVHLHL